MTNADWNFRNPPDLDQFEAMAKKAFDAMPEEFRRLCGNLVFHVEDLADRGAIHALGLESPMQLSGLFEGVGMPDAHVSAPYAFPNHVHLYRLPIIAEWRARGDITLMEMITHVLVHEIGHHFGFSDADMHAIEDEAGDG